MAAPNPAVGLYIMATLTGLGAAAAAWRARSFDVLGRALEEAILSEPGDITAPGYYLTRGKVRCLDPLKTPIDEQKAAQYSYRITEEDLIHHRHGSDVVARILKSEDRRVPFELVGPRGKLLVAPGGARMEGLELRNNSVRPGAAGMIAGQRRSIPDRFGSEDAGAGGYQWNPDARHEVVAVLDGSDVFALGCVERDEKTGELVLRASEDAPGPFVIMTARLDRVAEREARNGSIYWLTCWILGGLTLALLAAPMLF